MYDGIGYKERREKNALFLLYHRTIIQATAHYKHIMKNKELCNHYGHDPESVSKFNMLYNTLRVRNVFIWNKCKGINYFEKIGMDLKIFYLELKRKFGEKKNGD